MMAPVYCLESRSRPCSKKGKRTQVDPNGLLELRRQRVGTGRSNSQGLRVFVEGNT